MLDNFIKIYTNLFQLSSYFQVQPFSCRFSYDKRKKCNSRLFALKLK